jgi:hypothetical protein
MTAPGRSRHRHAGTQKRARSNYLIGNDNEIGDPPTFSLNRRRLLSIHRECPCPAVGWAGALMSASSACGRNLTSMVHKAAADDGRLDGQRPVDEVKFAKQLQGLLVEDPFRLFSVEGEGNRDA